MEAQKPSIESQPQQGPEGTCNGTSENTSTVLVALTDTSLPEGLYKVGRAHPCHCSLLESRTVCLIAARLMWTGLGARESTRLPGEMLY
jgi:hypothetical protein